MQKGNKYGASYHAGIRVLVFQFKTETGQRNKNCLLTVLSILFCGRSCSTCVLKVLKTKGDEDSDLDTTGIPSGADRAVAAELAQKLDDARF